MKVSPLQSVPTPEGESRADAGREFDYCSISNMDGCQTLTTLQLSSRYYMPRENIQTSLEHRDISFFGMIFGNANSEIVCTYF